MRKHKIILLVLITVFLISNHGYSTTIHGFSKEKDSASFYFKKAVINGDANKHDIAIENFLKAKDLYLLRGDNDSVAECNLQIYSFLIAQKNNTVDALSFLNDYKSYVEKSKDTSKLMVLLKIDANNFSRVNDFENAARKHKEIAHLAYLTKDQIKEADSYGNLGLMYTNFKIDSAQYFFDKALELYSSNNYYDSHFSIYLNYGNLYQKKGLQKKALEKLLKANEYEPIQYKLNLQRILYGKIASTYTKLNRYEKAYDYLLKYDSIKDIIGLENQNIAISEIQAKYDTQKLRADYLESEGERKQSQLITWLFFGGILIVSSLSYLQIKNSRRKRLIAIQEKELETQKNLTLLKEQEISTINAMVEGQEKERKRVAEDLHDNLGSVIATLKLHFDNLRINREKKKVDQETLFEKTENLIDEAYKKVRSIAHAKNAGVIANDGLLVALKLMAEKISSANSIQIDVIDYGLEKPIENSLEISLFRIIQELTTNIIKHAQADHATINITQDEDEITILIEDNGVGFDSSIIDLKKGMGLHSIQTRVEHLEGNLTIDSTRTKGTTIIIHIPT